MKKDILTLGIESSCDETSVSVVKNGREILSNVIDTQIPIHEKYGSFWKNASKKETNKATTKPHL